MRNLKDKLSTICGIILAAAGIVLTLATGGLSLPPGVVTTATALAAISGGIIAYLTGKNPNGKTKTAQAIKTQNENT